MVLAAAVSVRATRPAARLVRALLDGEVVVAADEARLKQVLRNLPRNAVQAAGKEGHVVVRILCSAAGEAA